MYYEYLNTDDATEAHVHISTLSAMRRWKKDEIELIKSKWPLSDDPPTLKDIRNFLKEDRTFTRSSKDILAKWQQLMQE